MFPSFIGWTLRRWHAVPWAVAGGGWDTSPGGTLPLFCLAAWRVNGRDSYTQLMSCPEPCRAAEHVNELHVANAAQPQATGSQGGGGDLHGAGDIAVGTASRAPSISLHTQK